MPLVRDGSEKPLYFVSQVEDITERKLAEEEKQRFYRDTVRSVTQGKLDLLPT